MKKFSLIEKQEAIEVLNNQIRACERCSLSVTREHALTGEGNIDASIMFIGPSSQVFNKKLHSSGIDRELVFMTNLIKCMLPKNRKPKMDEIELCSQFFNEEISIIHH